MTGKREGGADREFSPCRSCHRLVRWAKSAKTGKPMPLDEDLERGNVVLDIFGKAHVFGDHAKTVAAVAADEADLFGMTSVTYISHHAAGQCPQGPAWQGVRRGDPDEPRPAPAQGTLL